MRDVDVYERDAARLFEQYESLAFEAAHGSVLGALPRRPGTVLDVGDVRDVDDVFGALALLRASLRREQQLPEWAG